MGGVFGLFGGGGETVLRGEKIGDFQINTASYGEVVPDILGTTRVAGNVIYYDDFTAHEHRNSQRAGKGGGGHTTTQITYTYTVAVAIALSEGPISGIWRVWKDKELLYYPQSDIMLTLFDGRNGQQPWAYVQSKHPEKALPYSGLAYMAGVVDLGSSASLPTYNFEVKGKLLNTGDGVDVNPADYIAYVLRGIGITDAAIEGLDNYRKYCANADLLISSPPDTKEKKAQEIVNEIAEFTNACVFWSNDRLKIVPLADKPVGAWSPDTEVKYDLTADDFLPQSDGTLIQYKHKDSSECYNQATVEFLNRDNGYEKEAVSFDVVADIQVNGLRPAPIKNIHYLYTKKRASYVAEQLAMKQLYLKNQYTFKLDWAFCRLEPGDLVTITDEASLLERRVVVITDVQEAVDGELTITAVGKPPGLYSPARYDVHEVDRPFVDFNMEPPSVQNVTILQPPGDVGNGNEMLIGVTAPAGWGSCNVWLSDSGDAYRLIGTINKQARIGELVGSMTDTATTCTVKLYNGTLKSGTAEDAHRGNTLCYVDGECFSYETATLQSDGSYLLGGLVRGQYGSLARSHAGGTRFSRIDEAFLRGKYRQEDIGKQVYFKFTSMNVFGGKEQSLADVSATPYRIQAYWIPDVAGLSLFTRYHDLGKGLKSYDVVAQYTAPPIETFSTAEAYYQEGNGEWKYAGSGIGQIVISGLELGHTYNVRVVVKDTHDNYSQGVMKSITVAMKAEVPNTPEGFSVRFSDRAYFSWLEVKNADIDFYEVRLDRSPGSINGRIATSNNTTADGIIQSRTGTFYLYAHNPQKGYSAPAVLGYNLPAPVAPTNLQLSSRMGILQVTFAPIPAACRGANIYINEEVYFVTSHVFSLAVDAGIYDVSVAYVDMIGEGARSATERTTVSIIIPAEYIDQEALGITRMNEAIATINKTTTEKIGAINTTLSGIDTRIANGAKSALSGDISTLSSRITQLNDAVDTKVTNKIKGLDTRFTQLSNAITATANSLDGTKSQVTQLSNTITSTVNDVKGVKTSVTQLSNALDSVVKNDISGLSSRITQLDSGISLRITEGVKAGMDGDKIISQINLAKGAVKIEGKYIHITGTTQFDDNVIVGRMLQAKSIDASRLNVSSLSAITATIGTLRTRTSGARVEISDNLIQVFDANNRLRVRMGIW